jgi:hypothetical protein
VVSYVTPRRPRRGLYVVGATMVLASGAALFYAGRMAGRFDLHRSESGGAVEQAPAGRADAPAPEGASSAAAPPTEPNVAASASPQPSASSSASAAARPVNAPRRNPGPRPAAPKPSTPASPTSFRPNDL